MLTGIQKMRFIRYVRKKIRILYTIEILFFSNFGMIATAGIKPQDLKGAQNIPVQNSKQYLI